MKTLAMPLNDKHGSRSQSLDVFTSLDWPEVVVSCRSRCVSTSSSTWTNRGVTRLPLSMGHISTQTSWLPELRTLSSRVASRESLSVDKYCLMPHLTYSTVNNCGLEGSRIIANTYNAANQLATRHIEHQSQNRTQTSRPGPVNCFETSINFHEFNSDPFWNTDLARSVFNPNPLQSW